MVDSANPSTQVLGTDFDFDSVMGSAPGGGGFYNGTKAGKAGGSGGGAGGPNTTAAAGGAAPTDGQRDGGARDERRAAFRRVRWRGEKGVTQPISFRITCAAPKPR